MSRLQDEAAGNTELKMNSVYDRFYGPLTGSGVVTQQLRARWDLSNSKAIPIGKHGVGPLALTRLSLRMELSMGAEPQLHIWWPGWRDSPVSGLDSNFSLEWLQCVNHFPPLLFYFTHKDFQDSWDLLYHS